MKVKGPGPTTPPVTTAKTQGEIKSKSDQVANALAGMMGATDELKRSEKKDAAKETRRAQERKNLKAFGAKFGVKSGDSPREATHKIVHGVLSDQYDSKERGFSRMVDEITDFIQEQNHELKEKFDRWIKEMQS